MDALEAIRSKIPQFPGYTDEIARRDSDELIRSFLGEALASLQGRYPDPFAQHSEAYETLLLRAGFMNQQAFHAFEYRPLDPRLQAAIAVNDLALIELADRAATLKAEDIPAYLNDLDAAFDRRDAAMSNQQG